MTRAQRATYWLGEIATDVIVALLVYWPINIVCIRIAVWQGIPEAVGWQSPTWSQTALIALAFTVLDGPTRRRAA
jgi:hypothetical protein